MKNIQVKPTHNVVEFRPAFVILIMLTGCNEGDTFPFKGNEGVFLIRSECRGRICI